MKCVNVHVCQSCFMTQRHSRKHKAQHPVVELCTQVSQTQVETDGWRQVIMNMSMLMSSAHLERVSVFVDA